MKKHIGVMSNIKPKEFCTDSYKIYIAENITEKTIEDNLFYQYDELEYDKDEYTEILNKEQNKQDTDIVTNLNASAELFEMVITMISTPVLSDINNKNKNRSNINTKGADKMVEVYVTLIIGGHKTIDEVPAIIRPQVIVRLKQLGIEI